MRLQLAVLGFVLLLSACVAPGGGRTGSNVTTAKLLINEIMLFPEEGSTQWVELYNPGSKAVNLSGYVIEAKGLNGMLTSAVVEPKSYAVFVVSPAAASEEGTLGTLPGRLEGESDLLRLLDPAGVEVDSVLWDFTRGVQPPLEVTVTNPLFVLAGRSLARDRNSRDTGTSWDWFGRNGLDAVRATPGERNYHKISDNMRHGTTNAGVRAAASQRLQVRLPMLAVAAPRCGTPAPKVEFQGGDCDQVELLKTAVRMMQQTCSDSTPSVGKLDPDKIGKSGRKETTEGGNEYEEVSTGIGDLSLWVGPNPGADASGKTGHPEDIDGITSITLYSNTFDCNAEFLKITLYHELIHYDQGKNPNLGVHGPDGGPTTDGAVIKPSENRITDCLEAQAYLLEAQKLQRERALEGADAATIDDLLEQSKSRALQYLMEGEGGARNGCLNFLDELKNNKHPDGSDVTDPGEQAEYDRARKEFGDYWLDLFNSLSGLFAEKMIPDYIDPATGELDGFDRETFREIFKKMNLTDEEIDELLRRHAGGGNASGNTSVYYGVDWEFATQETGDNTGIFMRNNGDLTDSLYLVSKRVPEAYSYSSPLLEGKEEGSVVVTLEPGASASFTISYSPHEDTPSGEYLFEWVLASSRNASKTFMIAKTVSHSRPLG
ncbi:lamin tail domain-containing protein [Candidatus Micrarchaeota archaeon]|nr:lamin tail domain-containing protein [Candidatus Micrarchaeota archaeon]